MQNLKQVFRLLPNSPPEVDCIQKPHKRWRAGNPVKWARGVKWVALRDLNATESTPQSYLKHPVNAEPLFVQSKMRLDTELSNRRHHNMAIQPNCYLF